jgi:hypothetical protein
MRKKTVPRTRKQNKASSCGYAKGLIANDTTCAPSAGTESILDNRSHRTPRDKLRARPAPSNTELRYEISPAAEYCLASSSASTIPLGASGYHSAHSGIRNGIEARMVRWIPI